MKRHSLLLLITIIVLFQAVSCDEKDYTDFVNALKAAIQTPQHKGWAYNRLANFSDYYGPRMWGSSILEMAIQGLAQQAKAEGFDNVRLEPVTNFTKWVRGKESLTLYSPRPFPTKLDVIGLGHSVSGSVRGNVIVVDSWDELDDLNYKIKGKIVLFNCPWYDYDTNVDFRVRGASKAAAYGALAALVRSVTPSSISSVHAGTMFYDESHPKIPVAAITLEDADMFARMQKRGQTITIQLTLENQVVHGANSNNLVFEIKGSKYPEQVILMGGHIDSWDTGSQTGANDDGGGFMTVFEALRLLLKNGFRPKRTLRFIAWSGEEFGQIDNGAHQYAQRHANELNNHIAVFQSDEGSRTLLGFGFSGNTSDTELIKSIAEKYLSLINADLINLDGSEADAEVLNDLGVPMLKNVVQDTLDQEFYFRYHHTRGDSMSIMDPDQMDQNVLGIATLTFILADLQNTLNRT